MAILARNQRHRAGTTRISEQRKCLASEELGARGELEQSHHVAQLGCSWPEFRRVNPSDGAVVVGNAALFLDQRLRISEATSWGLVIALVRLTCLAIFGPADA